MKLIDDELFKSVIYPKVIILSSEVEKDKMELEKKLNGMISKAKIKKLIDNNKLIKVKKNLYRNLESTELSNQSLIDIAQAVPNGVVCLLSALSYYEMTTFIPNTVAVAISRDSRKIKINY